jgi:hypothetical protein
MLAVPRRRAAREKHRSMAAGPSAAAPQQLLFSTEPCKDVAVSDHEPTGRDLS